MCIGTEIILSPSGVHLGHTHAWTRIKSVARLRSEMDLFPHQHGFAPKSWQQIVDVMLEKTPGCLLILTNFVLLLFLSPNLTSPSRAIWPRRLMPNGERLGLLGSKQNGSRSGFQTHDCLLMQNLSMAICRIALINAIIANYDAS